MPFNKPGLKLATRKSTGGMAPRRQLAAKAAKPKLEETNFIDLTSPDEDYGKGDHEGILRIDTSRHHGIDVEASPKRLRFDADDDPYSPTSPTWTPSQWAAIDWTGDFQTSGDFNAPTTTKAPAPKSLTPTPPALTCETPVTPSYIQVPSTHHLFRPSSSEAAPPELTPPVHTTTQSPAATSTTLTSAEAQMPTPGPTPPQKKSIKDIPELADRYVPHVSTEEGVEYKNPAKFTLKPAFWANWTPALYRDFAEHLRLSFNPIPFAKETGLSVEEIRHVFSALVANPLYFAAEATQRGKEGMEEILALYKRYGTPSRPWGRGENGAKKVMGELSGVATGSIEIILEDGSKKSISVAEFSEVDIKYLKDTLSSSDKMLLGQTQGTDTPETPGGFVV